jgi:hypothetical protein
VPSVLRQGSAYELVNVKLIVVSNVRGAIGEIRAQVDAWGGGGGLQCQASGLHPQQ